MGVAHDVLDTAGVVDVEPALAQVAHKLTGALRLPNDETGDCKLFTERLAARAARDGVNFRYGVDVERLVAHGERIACVELRNGEVLKADAIVLATGCAARAWRCRWGWICQFTRSRAIRLRCR